MKSIQPSISVIIPHFNHIALTSVCYDALIRQGSSIARIIIVDNGSSAHDESALRSVCPIAVIIRLATNRGFAAAVNIGLRMALDDRSTTHAWILNNDTICPPETLEKLLAAVESTPDTGLAGCAMIEGKGTKSERIVAAGKNLLRPWMIPISAKPDRVPDYISGACLLVKRKTIEDIGLLDEGFFFFFEDADFSRRALLGGWHLEHAPDILIEHRGSSTVRHMSRFWAYHYRRSHVMYLRKHSQHHRMLAAPAFLARLLSDTLTLNIEAAFGNWLGFRSGLSGGGPGKRSQWVSYG